MKNLLLLLCVLFFGVGLKAQNLDVGIRIQKTHGMYWENGITAQYTIEKFKPDNFYIGLSYVSSRLGTAMSSNALKQDNYIFNTGWNFGKEVKPLRFHARLNFGYFHAEQVSDIFKDVPNTAFLFSPEIGLKYTFSQLPLTLNLGSGYYLFTGEGGDSPGTLQPLYYHLDVTYQIFKN
jgi:hypothetical protein